jgi:hypothetical protein
MEEDIDVSSKADFSTNIKDVKDNSETKTAKTIDAVEDAMKNPELIDLPEMKKDAKTEYHKNEAKVESYDTYAAKLTKDSSYKVADEEKAFRDKYDGTKSTSYVAQAQALEQSIRGVGQFKVDSEELITKLNNGEITDMSQEEVKKVIKYVEKVNLLPIKDSAYKTKLQKIIDAAKTNNYTDLRDALADIDLDKVKDEADFAGIGKEMTDGVKDSVEHGFLEYIPEIKDKVLQDLADGKPLPEVIFYLSNVATSRETGVKYKLVLESLKELETEARGKAKDDYLREVNAKKEEARSKYNALDEMAKYDSSISTSRSADKPQFDLSTLGLEKDPEGWEETTFDYSKKDADGNIVFIDPRDEKLEDDQVADLVDDLWNGMSASQRGQMISHTESNPPMGITIPRYTFGERIRGFFAHLAGRQTRRERELENYTKMAMSKAVSDENKKVYETEQIEAPKRDKNNDRLQQRDAFGKDVFKGTIDRMINSGENKKDASRNAVSDATKNAVNRNAGRGLDD